MTQTLIEQLKAIAGTVTVQGVEYFDLTEDDIRAIIEQHKQESGEAVQDCSMCQNNRDVVCGYCENTGIVESVDGFKGNCPQGCKPSHTKLIGEFVNILSDDAYAATFQSMAGYRTALIAKVKGVMG